MYLEAFFLWFLDRQDLQIDGTLYILWQNSRWWCHAHIIRMLVNFHVHRHGATTYTKGFYMAYHIWFDIDMSIWKIRFSSILWGFRFWNKVLKLIMWIPMRKWSRCLCNIPERVTRDNKIHAHPILSYHIVYNYYYH